MQVGWKAEKAVGVEVARHACLAACISRPAAVPETMMLNEVLADGREGSLSPKVNICRPIHIPAAFEPGRCFQLAQRGRLGLRIAKFKLSPVLSADTLGTL